MTLDSFSKGLEGVVAAQSSLCNVYGEEGRLVYRGLDIKDLAQNCSFEEVAHLLWFGSLPTRSQLQDTIHRMASERALPEGLLALMRAFPSAASPMEALRTAVSGLSMFDPEAEDMSPQANERKAIRLTARTATIVAAHHRLRSGSEPVSPRQDLGHAANFLYMLTGQEPEGSRARALDVALVLHADHELNASTFGARVTAATLADIYSAVATGVGTLKGPLHGGANEQVMRLLLSIGQAPNAQDRIEAELAAGHRIPGFGHRVYKTWDPRALVLKEIGMSLEKETTDLQWCRLALQVEQAVMAHRKLYPNVDFYSAPVYYDLGIPIDLFTPIFAISRVSGWTAHVLEQYSDNRLIRPRALYTGADRATFVPMDQRTS